MSRLAWLIIVIMLVVGDVELNPCPFKIDDLAPRIDNLLTDIRDTRVSLSTKIDESFHEYTVQIRVCEDIVTFLVERIVALETANAAIVTKLIILRASLALLNASAPPSVVSVSTSLVMNNVCELNLHALKKTRIVLLHFKPSHMDDALVVFNLLCDELGINATVVSCIRLRKLFAYANQPQRLLATLLDNVDSCFAVRLAKKLRNSNDTRVRSH